MNQKIKQPEAAEIESLKDRATPLNGEPMDFSAANKAIDALAQDFVERLPEEFERMEAAFAAMSDNPEDQALRTVLFRLVHDLKGQAGTFDYLLITVIGNDLCRFLETPINWTSSPLMVIRFHLDAMKWVANKGLTGDGDKHGQRMIETLHGMTQRLLQEQTTPGH